MLALQDEGGGHRAGEEGENDDYYGESSPEGNGRYGRDDERGSRVGGSIAGSRAGASVAGSELTVEDEAHAERAGLALQALLAKAKAGGQAPEEESDRPVRGSDRLEPALEEPATAADALDRLYGAAPSARRPEPAPKPELESGRRVSKSEPGQPEVTAELLSSLFDELDAGENGKVGAVELLS